MLKLVTRPKTQMNQEMQSKMKKMRNNEIHTFCFFKPRIYFESKPVWRDSNSKVSKPYPPIYIMLSL